MLVAEPITGQMSQHITQLNKAINRACAVLINAHLYVVHSGLSVASYVYAKKGHFQCSVSYGGGGGGGGGSLGSSFPPPQTHFFTQTFIIK